MAAAKLLFEECGWAGTTLGAVAAEAGISQKSVEAIHKNKAGLLQATIDYANNQYEAWLRTYYRQTLLSGR